MDRYFSSVMLKFGRSVAVFKAFLEIYGHKLRETWDFDEIQEFCDIGAGCAVGRGDQLESQSDSCLRKAARVNSNWQLTEG